jgi:hypothetical protein
MIMAYRRGGIIDHAVSIIGSGFHAIPNYLLAILIVVVGAVQLGVIDYTRMRGNVSPGVSPELSIRFLSDIGYHATLPMITYILTTVGTWALIMKASTTQVLGEDYVTVARARGLKDARIQTNYVGRNALLPLIAQIATQAGFIVGGRDLRRADLLLRGRRAAAVRVDQHPRLPDDPGGAAGRDHHRRAREPLRRPRQRRARPADPPRRGRGGMTATSSPVPAEQAVPTPSRSSGVSPLRRLFSELTRSTSGFIGLCWCSRSCCCPSSVP